MSGAHNDPVSTPTPATHTGQPGSDDRRPGVGGIVGDVVFPRWCLDCEMNLFLEWFTVHDDVWSQTGLARHGGCLCIGCVERRIGRRLTADDFPATENNRPDEMLSDRLLNRLGMQLVCEDADGNQLAREDAQPWIRDYDNPPP